MTTQLPSSHLDLLDEPVVVMLATLMPDGRPQVTPVWCSRHGDEVWVNTAKGRQKDRNLRARPFATIAATDPADAYRWLEIRADVAGIVEGQAAHDHINDLAQAYFGRPFRTNTPDEQRVIFKLRPTAVNTGG
ncbi:MAG: PPOX class F420-dependent oxidoreductase [Anaerolineales bacterium]|nr:PPOX class F420-dependent oxidoreductase [Anaerolineales bacterium]